MINSNIQFERIGLATEKSDILTGLPLNNSGTITGDSKMKIYQKEYQQSEKGKAVNRKAVAKYRQTPKGKAVRHKKAAKYQKTEKGKATQKRYNIRYPERRKARHAVEIAVKIGQISQPNSLQCSYGNHQAEQYHHHKGYAKKHWFDVLPTCRKCHNKLHLKKIAI